MKYNFDDTHIGGTTGCPCCNRTYTILPLDVNLYYGFGGYEVFRDGELWYQADRHSEMLMNGKLLSEIEADAKQFPDSDWRIVLNLPLRDAEWKRHADNMWVLIKTGPGFA